MSCIKDIRELLWPLLDPLKESRSKNIDLEDCKFQNEDNSFLLESIEKYSQSEEDRRKAIESKSAIFIGSFGIAVTALFIVAKEIVIGSNLGLFDGAVVTCLAILIIYLLRTIWFSIKALERRAYKTVGFPDFLLSDTPDKKRSLIIETYNSIHANQSVINLKVDYMVMAQEYFKRVVVALVISLAVLTFGFFYSFITVKDNGSPPAPNCDYKGECVAAHSTGGHLQPTYVTMVPSTKKKD